MCTFPDDIYGHDAGLYSIPCALEHATILRRRLDHDCSQCQSVCIAFLEP